MAENLPEPESRKETFLAKAAGENVELPTPASREELFLKAIADNGGGGGGGEGDVEYVDLTLTGPSQQGLAVTASKYMDEVLELAEDDKRVIFRITLPSGTGYPTSGTYELPLFNYEDNDKALAMTVVALGDTLYSIIFGYDLSGIVGDHTNVGNITIEVVPTGGSGSAIHTLTSADYNWDKTGQGGTPNAIAAWLLEDGIYLVKTENVYYDTATYSAFNCILIKGTRATGVGFLFGCDRESSWSVRLYADGTSCDIVTNLNSGNLQQTIGNSTTDGMSQDAITGMIFPDSTQINRIAIAGSVTSTAGRGVAIGNYSYVSGNSGVALGAGDSSTTSATVTAQGGVAIGAGATATTVGEFNIGSQSTSYGYNNTNYRLLTGVHNPVNAHDAATKGYVDAHSGGSSSITVLTSADYNYDPDETGTDTNIAGWLLNDGWYMTSGADTYGYNDPDEGYLIFPTGTLFSVKTHGSHKYFLCFINNANNGQMIDSYDIADSGVFDGDYPHTLYIDAFESLQDELTGIYDAMPICLDSAPTSDFYGTLGQLYTDTTNMHTYQLTAIDETDPDNPIYTWTQRW